MTTTKAASLAAIKSDILSNNSSLASRKAAREAWVQLVAAGGIRKKVEGYAGVLAFPTSTWAFTTMNGGVRIDKLPPLHSIVELPVHPEVIEGHEALQWDADEQLAEELAEEAVPTTRSIGQRVRDALGRFVAR